VVGAANAGPLEDLPPKKTERGLRLAEFLARLEAVAREAPTPNREDTSMMLAAIVAHPDDDTPRAVFADWLTERRDPRGEFIALQLVRTQRKQTPRNVDAKPRCWRVTVRRCWARSMGSSGRPACPSSAGFSSRPRR